MTKNWEKFAAGIFIYNFFFFKNFYFYLSLGLRKGRPSYSRSLHPQKRTSSTSKHENSLLFLFFCGSLLPSWIRIRIQQLKLLRINPDPDPQPCVQGSSARRVWLIQFLKSISSASKKKKDVLRKNHSRYLLDFLLRFI
jgi:hypothetical protein